MGDWFLPDTLAARVLDRLGVAAPVDVDGVGELVEALGRHLPRGSTVKLDAVARGVRPPGHDPVEVAEGWLRDQRAAWTCWGAATLAAALVRVSGVVEARVMAVRRRGEDAPPVDFHSVMEVGLDGERWVCDPHFGVPPVPRTGGEGVRAALRGELAVRSDGRFDWTVSGPMFSTPALLYRSLTGPLAPEDVRAFCDVSVTHSGVAKRPFALLLLPDGCGTLRAEAPGGPAELRLWRVPSPSGADASEPERIVPGSWVEGMDVLLRAARAGREGGSPLRS